MADRTGHNTWIELPSVQFSTSDTFTFTETSAGRGSGYGGFAGGITVAGGDVNDAPPHAVDLSTPPSTAPGTSAPTGTVTFFVDGLHHDGTHGLDQDLMLH